MLGAAVGFVPFLFHFKDYDGRGLAYLMGAFIGSVVGAALLFAFVAGLRNKLVFGKHPELRRGH